MASKAIIFTVESLLSFYDKYLETFYVTTCMGSHYLIFLFFFFMRNLPDSRHENARSYHRASGEDRKTCGQIRSSSEQGMPTVLILISVLTVANVRTGFGLYDCIQYSMAKSQSSLSPLVSSKLHLTMMS